MSVKAELLKSYETVWAFRRKWGEYWLTPDMVTALRFAVTEAGEAMDAFLRDNAGFPRNNARNMNVLDELADLAIMLLTVFDKDYLDYITPTPLDLDGIVASVARALDRRGVKPVMQYLIYDALYAIATYPGMILNDRIKRRLERIYQKHVEPRL